MRDCRISLDGTWEFLYVADDRQSGRPGPADHRSRALAGSVR